MVREREGALQEGVVLWLKVSLEGAGGGRSQGPSESQSEKPVWLGTGGSPVAHLAVVRRPPPRIGRLIRECFSMSMVPSSGWQLFGQFGLSVQRSGDKA